MDENNLMTVKFSYEIQIDEVDIYFIKNKVGYTYIVKINT